MVVLPPDVIGYAVTALAICGGAYRPTYDDDIGYDFVFRLQKRPASTLKYSLV